MSLHSRAIALVVAIAVAAALSAGLIRLLRPLLVRYALARPSARSSHAAPTPQGGGIAVVTGALAATAVGIALGGASVTLGLLVLLAATVGLAALGAVDDVRSLPPGWRLLAQAGLLAAVIYAANPGRILPEWVPIGAERTIMLLAGLWWVNLVNFMDGLDWLTVSAFVPMLAALALFGLLSGPVRSSVALLAAALLGGLLGFAPSNRPVARLFLGDVGSLPIGLLTGWMLLHLAASGAFAAALLLPLYYLADASLTLTRRLLARERVWEAHRTHFYQRARDHGWTVQAIDRRVFGLNASLAILAGGTVLWPGGLTAALSLLGGAALVAETLGRFSRPPRSA